VGYWALDEGEGQMTADRSIYGNDGVLGSTAEQDVNDPVWTDASQAVSVEATRENRPTQFHLYPNYPNPFNPATTIRYKVDTRSRVRIDIFNLLGEIVFTLKDGIHEPGSYLLQWTGSDQNGRLLPSGLYFCRLQADGYSGTIKLLLVR
jgi:hypothetical protein